MAPAPACRKNHPGGHPWATTGDLRILGCEVQCQICLKHYPTGWQLRRHALVHLKGTGRQIVRGKPGRLALGYPDGIAKGVAPPSNGTRGETHEDAINVNTDDEYDLDDLNEAAPVVIKKEKAMPQKRVAAKGKVQKPTPMKKLTGGLLFLGGLFFGLAFHALQKKATLA